MEGTNPVRVGVGLTNLLGWGAKAGHWMCMLPGALSNEAGCKKRHPNAVAHELASVVLRTHKELFATA